jgi:5-methylcytosine-specific restriction enzyme subunit McrC
MRTWIVKEYETFQMPANAWPEEAVRRFVQLHGKRFDVQAPTLFNGHQWQIKPEGYVGRVPLSDEFCLVIEPKVGIRSLFRMLEYAYDLGCFYDQEVPVGAIDTLLQSLAIVLAERVTARARRGLYRAYEPRHEALPLVRERIDLAGQARRPWQVAVPCHYQEHTDDVLENQALACALRLILRSGICDERAQPRVRRSYQAVHALLPERSLAGADLAGIALNRLNADYQPMLALCRFFLDHLGAEHLAGERDMLPFLIDMPALFERFVGCWLKQHLHDGWQVREQETLDIARYDDGTALRFRADVVIRRAGCSPPWCVLDTKYKAADKIVESDLHQVVSYAKAYGAGQAVLVYPEPPPLAQATVGSVTVRFLTFDLAQEIESVGETFKRALLGQQMVDSGVAG